MAERQVAFGAVIHADCFSSCQRLTELGFEHQTVNHATKFRQGDACTNGVEILWCFVKERLLIPTMATRRNTCPCNSRRRCF